MIIVAILGLGSMGKRMAQNYVEAGYCVHLYNRSKIDVSALLKKGAKFFDTPKACVLNADIVISMLKDDSASENVWLDENTGAITALKQDSIAIECSTISHNWSLQLHQHFKNKGFSLLDAPVMGSLPQVEARQLMHFVGGSEDLLQRVKPILSVSASEIFYVGKEGNGHGVKLLANGFFGMQVASLCETLSLITKLDIAKDEAIRVLNALPITSVAIQNINESIKHENFQPLFPIELVVKDFKYLLDLSNDDNHPIMEFSHSIFSKANTSGFGENNISGLALLYGF